MGRRTIMALMAALLLTGSGCRQLQSGSPEHGESRSFQQRKHQAAQACVNEGAKMRLARLEVISTVETEMGFEVVLRHAREGHFRLTTCTYWERTGEVDVSGN